MEMDMRSTPSLTAASIALMVAEPGHPRGTHALYMAILALRATPLALPPEKPYRSAQGTSAPAAVEATWDPSPMKSLGLGSLYSGTGRLPVKDLAPTSLLLQSKVALNPSASSQLPLQVGRTGPRPVSLKLARSGQMPVSMMPMMMPSPNSESGP
jgi:hypothetical protein